MNNKNQIIVKCDYCKHNTITTVSLPLNYTTHTLNCDWCRKFIFCNVENLNPCKYCGKLVRYYKAHIRHKHINLMCVINGERIY